MSESEPTLLYAEDDLSLSFVTQDTLERAGFRVIHSRDGEEALAQLQQHAIDLCILDVMLPKVDGFAVARAIRARDANVPILFLTAKSLKEDRIEGLTLGADDYITKPFSIEELILRIRVFLRRRQSVVADDLAVGTLRLGQQQLCVERLTLSHNNGEVKKLTYREGQLLAYLAQRKNTLLRREDILWHIWKDDDYFAGRSLDVFISRLRKYLRNDTTVRIENVHGVGFRLVEHSS